MNGKKLIKQRLYITKTANELRAMSKNGLKFCKDEYDKKRYKRLLKISKGLFRFVNRTEFDKKSNQFWEGDLNYATPLVGIAGMVFEKNKLLLIQRKDNERWAMPGGWVEVGSTPSKAVEREVKEETGIKVKAEKLVGIYDSYVHGFTNLNHIYHLVIYCKRISGIPKAQTETLAVKYFSEKEIKKLELYPGHDETIFDAFKSIKRKRPEPFFD